MKPRKRKANREMLSSTFPPEPVALGVGYVAKAPLPQRDDTAHARSANELLARASAGASRKASSPPEPGRGRPNTLHLQGGSHGVLLFHGLSSTPAELTYLARGLNRAGYTVRVPVIDGYTHGLSATHQMGHKQWLASALTAFDALRSRCSTVSVGGLCIGSLLALGVSAARPSLASAMLGLSTTLRYDGWANPWTRHLLHVLRYVPIGREMRIREREPFGVKDQRIRALIAAQMRATGASEAGASQLRVRDLLEAQRLAHFIRQSMHGIKSPTLLIHAKEDESASPRSSFEVAKGVSSRHVKLVLLNNSYHMISIDRERSKVLSEMKGFLGEHLGAEQSSCDQIPESSPAEMFAPEQGGIGLATCSA